MRWEPAKPDHDEARRRPWALLTAGVGRLRCVTHDGTVREAREHDAASLLTSLHGYVCYSRSTWRRLVCCTSDAREWTLHTWKRESVTRATHRPTGLVVRPLAATLPDSELDAVEAVGEWLAWLAAYGIPAGGLATAASKLLTTTLRVGVRLDCPVNPREALRGGRMHAPVRGRFRDVRYQDLKAAYPSALASAPVVTAWHAADPHSGSWLDADDGLARITATLPDDGSPWGSLPVARRPGEASPHAAWPADGRTVEGLWTLDDVRVGLEAGVRIDRVEGVWLARSRRTLFDQWWERACEGKAAMPDNPLVKATISRLWGAFAMRPAAGKAYPTDAWCSDVVRVDSHDPDAPVPRALAGQAHVAAFTAARVRARVWREALDAAECHYADTDGVVTPMGVRLSPTGDRPGEWRTMATLDTLDVAGPQMIRYLPHGDDTWRYATSGVPPALQASVFAEVERGSHEGTRPVLDERRNRGRADDAMADAV